MASRAMGQTLIITTYRDLWKNTSLLELAKDNRERQATDPKDKLYSLLGIASDIDPLCFAPNCPLETAKVYGGFAAHAIAESKKLEILQHSTYVENRTEEQGYCRPYWAPDWSISESLFWIDTIKEPFKPPAKLHYMRGEVHDSMMSVHGMLADRAVAMKKNILSRALADPKDSPRTATSEHRVITEILGLISSF